MRRSIPLPASAISSLKWIPHQHFQDSLACPSAERIAPSHFHLGCQPDLLSFVPDPLLFLCVYMLSCVRLFAIPWTAPHQASLSITNSQSLLKFVSIESVMPSNHLILCCLLLFLHLSQNQGLFQLVSSSHQVAKVLELQLQPQSFQWIFRIDFL